MIAVAEVTYIGKKFVQGFIKRKKDFIISVIPAHYNFEVLTNGFADKEVFFVKEHNKKVLDKIEGIKSYTSIIAIINITTFGVEILDIITDTATADEVSNIIENHKTIRKFTKLF